MAATCEPTYRTSGKKLDILALTKEQRFQVYSHNSFCIKLIGKLFKNWDQDTQRLIKYAWFMSISIQFSDMMG